MVAVPDKVSGSPANSAVIGAWEPASARTSSAPPPVTFTVAPVIVVPASGSVTVSSASITVAAAFSV